MCWCLFTLERKEKNLIIKIRVTILIVLLYQIWPIIVTIPHMNEVLHFRFSLCIILISCKQIYDSH